jgi:hypothetical protein
MKKLVKLHSVRLKGLFGRRDGMLTPVLLFIRDKNVVYMIKGNYILHFRYFRKDWREVKNFI